MDADPTVVEHHLRELAPDAVAALVADLWAARGYETRREGGRVVASRDGRTVVLAVPGSGGAPPPGEVDVVVAPGGRRATATADHGARVLDATGLRKALWHAVDREATRALCERHLGAAPGDLPPPAPRLAARLAAPTRTVVGLAARLRSVPSAARLVRPAALVVTVVAVAVLAAAGGLALVDGEAGGAAAGGPSTPGGTPATVPTATARPVFPGLEGVPGVNAGGVADPAALAAAHDRALGGRYTVWLDVYWRADGAASWRQRDIDVAVAGDRYLLEAEVEDGAVRRPVLAVYRDGSARHVATHENGTADYRTLPPAGDSPAWVPEPGVLRERIVSGYIATPETNVTGVVEESGRTYYRVVGTGSPPGPVPSPGNGMVAPADVGNYTVVALVDPRGLVAALEARYTVPGPAGPVQVRFQATYGQRGRTTVDPPEWYEAAATGNRTDGAAATGG